jgi:hypothetical protein
LCHYCIRRAICPIEWEDNENGDLQSNYKAVVVAYFKVCAKYMVACAEQDHLGFAVSRPRTKLGTSHHEASVLAMNLQIWLCGTQERARTRKAYNIICKVQID